MSRVSTWQTKPAINGLYMTSPPMVALLATWIWHLLLTTRLSIATIGLTTVTTTYAPLTTRLTARLTVGDNRLTPLTTILTARWWLLPPEHQRKWAPARYTVMRFVCTGLPSVTVATAVYPLLARVTSSSITRPWPTVKFVSMNHFPGCPVPGWLSKSDKWLFLPVVDREIVWHGVQL